MDWALITKFANSLTIAAGLLIIIVTGAKGLWVFGREFMALQKDRDDYKKLATDCVDTMQRVLHACEKQ